MSEEWFCRSERAQLPLTLHGCLQVEVVRSMQIDMTGENRRKMLQVALQDRISRRTQVIECCLHISGIPDSNDVQQQAQAGRTIELTGEISVGQYPKLPIGDKTRQAMHRFSLVEHASHTASIGFVGKERQNIDGLEHASVFLQATMDEVLVVE